MTTVKQTKEVQGLVSCLLEHEVTKTTATFKWDGPKIDPEIWRQVLAFFRWTNAEHNSESQVRFFVNSQTRIWTAWAFPQEARTGMSAHELDTPATREQRAMFSDADGWIYWGTAHHHCGGGAFQSGTDERNEYDQDGLHLTVGAIGHPVHDLHARLYVKGYKLEPDMSWFWDVSVQESLVPDLVKPFMSADWRDKLARRCMCIAPSPTQEFPPQWKANVIEVRRDPIIVRASGLGYSMAHDPWPQGGRNHKKPWNLERDVQLALQEYRELIDDCNSVIENEKDKLDAESLLETIDDQQVLVGIIELLQRNDVDFDSLKEAFDDDEQEKYLTAQAEQENPGKVIGPKLDDQNSGVSDYDGYLGGMLPE